MKQKCIKCKQIFEPMKEDEVAQIGVIKRNKLTPELLCDMLSPTFGECTDGDLHLTTYDDNDRQRVTDIIKKYDNAKNELENESKHNNELISKKKELLNQLNSVVKEIQESSDNIIEKEEEIKNNLIDYESITNTNDIEFYKMTTF